MINNPPTFVKPDPEMQRKLALAKIYDLLIKLVEEKGEDANGIAKEKEIVVPLKTNIPIG